MAQPQQSPARGLQGSAAAQHLPSAQLGLWLGCPRGQAGSQRQHNAHLILFLSSAPQGAQGGVPQAQPMALPSLSRGNGEKGKFDELRSS